MRYDTVIIGGGVIGGAVARELSRYKLTCCILEMENDVAVGASKANSGIVHGGYDPEPATLKARLNVEGVEKIFAAAEELSVPYRRNGSLVCAFSAEEDKTVNELYERGIKNGVKGLSVISGDEARTLEPNLSEAVISALLVANAGIICPYDMTIAEIGNAMDNGVHLKCNFKVESIEKTNNCFTVTAESGESVECRYLVNCAGGYAGKIAEMAGDSSIKIIPRAGEYMLLDKSEGNTVKHTIFQVPTANGKGILVTPTADGNLLVGPTAEIVDTCDDTDTTAKGLRSVSLLAAKSIPTVDLNQVITSFSGVRASTEGGDFIIQESNAVKGLINVAGIDSPGLSSCIAIAEYTVNVLRLAGLRLTQNTDFNGKRPDTHFFRKMSDEEKNEYIKSHPEYGRIICRCETVSEGEIVDAIKRNPPARDVDGVKRRIRAGMGRCQGGFCSPYVMKLISRCNGIPLEEVTKRGGKSNMVIGKL